MQDLKYQMQLNVNRVFFAQKSSKIFIRLVFQNNGRVF